REYHLVELPADGKGDAKPTTISIRQTRPSSFDITVNETTYSNVTSTFSPSTSSLTTFYPHTRLSTTFITSPSPSTPTTNLTLFTRGKQHKFQLALPKWAEKALGVKDVTNSVLAPMPCKVLRVEVKEGDTVEKDQALVVIESMKMETVIRSPGRAVVGRVVHGVGDLVRAGTALVEFLEEGK
ncbi:single hybrid motif-containing protein, partial [Amniculicola lignicola CBS 123094]